MSKLSKEDKELWLSVNKDTKRLENQNTIKPNLNKCTKDTFNDANPIKREIRHKFAVEKRKLTLKNTTSSPKKVKKAISLGRFKYDAIIDLHGKTLQEAYADVINFIKFCYRTGKRHVMIITGHNNGQGSIKNEFCIWLEESSIKEYVVSVKEAHYRQGGSGAYYIIVRRNLNV